MTHNLREVEKQTLRVGKKNDETASSSFFFLFPLSGDVWKSLTVLATRETLYLLQEDHQWRKSSSSPEETGEPSSGSVVVLETLPISCVSSVQLSPSDPCRIDVKLYDEVSGISVTMGTIRFREVDLSLSNPHAIFSPNVKKNAPTAASTLISSAAAVTYRLAGPCPLFLSSSMVISSRFLLFIST